ncbi:MAG: TOTE conflict system archaeo-eukaryotic primase domain-containing protein [Candidatus Marinarcus sp.]|uniref:TOTE conflict system archaeo-eukaryotic primase domain-containing protein n=1 Tax=Candidatus Marinarcus sp. TaxID=3100987 RepID=UPI003AFF9BA1
MNDIEKKLQALYLQKEEILKEIALLEEQINTKKEFSKEEKIELFKSLFVGKTDIYAKKWVSKDTKKQAYFPVTRTFKGEDYLPLSNEAIEQHLRGNEELATYSIIASNLCNYLVLEIIEADLYKIKMGLNQLKINGYFERTASGDFHVWIFFSTQTEAKRAKELGEKIYKHSNTSGKIYPNQAFSNQSNLGTPLALPLQLKLRDEEKTVFIDVLTKQTIEDQWDYLSHVTKVSRIEIEHLTSNSEDTPLFIENHEKIIFPNKTIKMYLNDFIYINTVGLSKSLLNTLKAMASFDNPQVKILLQLRKPLFNVPRVIKSYEEHNQFLKLPRGLLVQIKELFQANDAQYSIEERRFFQAEQFGKVLFTLRKEQNEAIKEIIKYDNCICVAPPGFGKTLIGAKMIELRGCNTLIVVNKNMLLDQWIERCVDYFNMNKKEIGYLGKGKNKLNKKLDIATMQSLKNTPELVENYSFVIVDECHHIPAVTFEQIIKGFKGKYILGLSATPNRKDGLEPILFQQLGQIAYEFKKKKTYTNKVKIVKTDFESNLDNYANIIGQVCLDKKRNAQIIKEIKQNSQRHILVLTDRLEHISELEQLLEQEGMTFLSVHGNQSKKEQSENMQLVQEAKLILATTSFFGEGIDFPHLNTIIFATPISYYGRLIQYLGRIGRDGQDCLAIDFLDTKNAMLYSAYKKRKEGYKQMHYTLLREF